MEAFDVYRDIAARTQGQIYLGLVGPVRTGKSTFIKRFMELAVLPQVSDEHLRTRMVDELPQSAAGRTIMTTQPHFVPESGAQIQVGETTATVRLIDCVGYLTRGALGYLENGQPRLVQTPWSTADMPFEEAAELGTQKVITEHATVGIVMTTDGSVTELPRAGYVEAEEQVVNELRALGKPFVLVLNSATPHADETMALGSALSEKYGVSVCVLDVLNMTVQDIHHMMNELLMSFPLSEIHLEMPTWAQALPADHWLPAQMLAALAESAEISLMRDAAAVLPTMMENEHVTMAEVSHILAGTGSVYVSLTLREGMYYELLSEACGMNITGDYQLLQLLREYSGAKAAYDRYNTAIESALNEGYGMVAPTLEEMMLDEPQIVRRGGQFGVKLKASAPTLHILRVGVEAQVSPIIGTEKQSEDMQKYLLGAFENDPQKLWDTDFFGRSLHDMVKENLSGKLMRLPADVQQKMTGALSRIINEGSGGMICILL